LYYPPNVPTEHNDETIRSHTSLRDDWWVEIQMQCGNTRSVGTIGTLIYVQNLC